MKKNIYQSPTLEINEISLATGICNVGSSDTPPTTGGDSDIWEAPRRA